MKQRSIKIISILMVVIICLVTLVYLYLSKGEVLSSDKIGWIKEIPIAHRGLFDNIHPENSLSAFKNAVKNNYAIELDVQFTKDKKVVVFHDDNLERLTKDKRNINEVTYEELSKLKILDSNEKIPLLQEVLDLVDTRVPIVIEIKDCKDIIDLGETTYNITKHYKGDYSIQSFNPFVLEWYKNNAKEVIRGQLSGTFKEDAENLNWYEKFALENLMLNFKSKPNYIAYELRGLPHFRITYLRKNGLPILSWTINSQDQLKRAYKYSDNIIFDRFMPSK